ncbi:MAG: anthranilate phosphoribosyltransferase [Gammaproteobacteria bacterium]|nr:anthranilate phosphoribosyltransferase [Gammaproteobacteria bacterium]MBU1968144.1 anthranilate phosphoribosyltransferase [Gammaproteobacteria bacterium]
MKPQDALKRIIEHREIFHDEMVSLMRQIMGGEVTPVMIAAIITGLRVKKETIGEIAGAASVMRELSTKVDIADDSRLVDTCGTGGDGAHTFNISTASAFVAAAAGAKIAKHGGRSVSSQSGSADVLEALGININLTPEQAAKCINEVGFGFMFAPNYHSAMKHAAPVRKELGVRTLFNILGPLTNPAGAKQQLLGVFHPDLVGIQARVLQRLGSKRVMVVHGADGLDEITLTGNTMVAELKDGEVREYTVHPKQFGLNTAALEDIQATNVQASRDMILDVLENKSGPALDIVLMNAGASIYLAGLADTLENGVKKAAEVIASGAAKNKLAQLVQASKA